METRKRRKRQMSEFQISLRDRCDACGQMPVTCALIPHAHIDEYEHGTICAACLLDAVGGIFIGDQRQEPR